MGNRVIEKCIGVTTDLGLLKMMLNPPKTKIPEELVRGDERTRSKKENCTCQRLKNSCKIGLD
jgi:hypothetical protein